MYYVNLLLKHMGFQQTDEPRDPEMQNLLQIIKYKFVPPRGYISPTETLIINYQKRYEQSELDRFNTLCNENAPIETIFEEIGFPIKPNIPILKEIQKQVNFAKNPGSSQLDFDFNQLLFNKPSSNSNSNNSNSNTEKTNSNNVISDIIVYGALHQGIAWVADLQNHTIDFAIDLISIFLDLVNSPQIHLKPQTIIYVDCVFSLIVKSFLHDCNLNLTDSFVAAVLTYLSGSYSITESFTDIFNSFFAQVIKSGLPLSVTHILRVTQQFIHEQRPFIRLEDETVPETAADDNSNNNNNENNNNNNDNNNNKNNNNDNNNKNNSTDKNNADQQNPKTVIHSSLFSANALSPLIKSLDPNLIELICASANSTKFLEIVRQLLDLLANAICQNIIELDDFSEFNKGEIEIDDSPDLTPSAFDEKFEFLNEGKEIADMKYSSSDLEPLIKILKKSSRDLESYLPPKTKNVILLISVMFANMSSRYLESFLSIIFQNVIENLGKPHYIEFYAMILFLFEKLSGKFSLSLFKNSFLSPAIFNPKYYIFKYEKSINLNSEENDEDLSKFLIISDFRCFVFNIISSSSQTLLYQLLNYASLKSPYLFSEQILRIYFNLSQLKIELFCSENINELILDSSYQLQKLFMESPTNVTRLARISIFEFYFKVIEDSTGFMISSSSPFFSKCYFHFLFEPSLTTLLLNKLRNGFVNANIRFTVPVFLKFVPTICEILDYISSTPEILKDERYSNLANQIVHCITDSLSHNASLIHSFVPIFSSILIYVWKNPSEQLLQECFLFLFILSQSSPSFYFSPEMFQLLSDIIKFVEGKEPSKETHLKFYAILSGLKQTVEDAMYLIKSPQFIPLIFVSFSQSTRLIQLFEYFSSLCKYSPSNCVACNKGDLDFLLLQILKYKNSFEYNGYKVNFLLDLSSTNIEYLSVLFNLISHIISVKTSVVIVDQLFKLTLPSSYFQPHFAQNILLIILNSITSEVNKKRPIFDIYLNKPICQIEGLTDKEVNFNLTISFWIKLDIPLLASFSDSLTILSIESSDKANLFKLYVSGGSLLGSYKSIKNNKNSSSAFSHGVLIDHIPSNDWTLLTFDIFKQPNDAKTAVYVYKYSDQIGYATFNQFNFASNSKINLVFGDSTKDNENINKEKGPSELLINEKSNTNLLASTSNYKIIGQLGPFCIFDSKSEHTNTNQQFAFTSDPNFENFKTAILTSSNIIEHYLSNNEYIKDNQNQKVKNKRNRSRLGSKKEKNSPDLVNIRMSRFQILLSNVIHFGNCLNDVLYSVYDLNYLTYFLTQFKPENYDISIQILEIILSSLSSSIIAQRKYISVPILAKSLPIIFKNNLNYKLYLTLYSSLTSFKYEPLIREFLDFLIFNFELWSNADLQSIIRILQHWSSSVYDMFISSKSPFLDVSRMLSVFDIVFFSETKTEIVTENDFGCQADFTLNEMKTTNSFSISHTKEEVQEVQEAFLIFIEECICKSMCDLVAYSIYSHIFATYENKEKTIVLLNLLDRLGPKIKTLSPEFQKDFIKPLQYFFNTKDIDIILSALFALYSLATPTNIHLLLSTASIQIQLVSDSSAVFHALLPHIYKKCNLYSLICLLSLSLGQEEQNKVVLIIKEILNNPKMSESIHQSMCWSIWPIILALYNTPYGSKIKYKHQNQDGTLFQTNLAIMTEFFATQLLRFNDFISEFRNILAVILLLANGWKTAGFELESDLIFVLSKHVFASTNESIIKIRNNFLRAAFNNIFFSNVYNRNTALFNEFKKSPFYKVQLPRRSTVPIEISEVNSPAFYPPLLSAEINNNEVKLHKISSELTETNIPSQEALNNPRSQIKKKGIDKFAPFDSFSSFINFRPLYCSTENTFQLRINEENKWIDSKLCSTLVTMIPCIEKPHQALALFKDIVDFVRLKYPDAKEDEQEDNSELKHNMAYLNDIQSKISSLRENSKPPLNKAIYSYLTKSFEMAQTMIFEGLSGVADDKTKIALGDIKKEIIRIREHHDKYKNKLNEIEKNLVFPRNPQLLIDLNKNTNGRNVSQYYKRDNCSCFDLCPIKTKPVIKEKSYKIWELRRTKQIKDKLYADIETQTEKTDEEENEEIKNYKNKNSKYSVILPCSIVTPTKIKKAIFLLSTHKMCLVSNDNNNKYQICLDKVDPNKKYIDLKPYPNKVINLPFYKIMSIFKRKRFQRNTAIEIFLNNGENYLIDFDPVFNDGIISQLADNPYLSSQHVQKETSSSFFTENIQRTTNLWSSGQMSNFTYLMALNTFSGRTFNDILQYPIFPLITHDLNKLDRNLSFPITYQESPSEEEEVYEDEIFLEVEKIFRTSPVPSNTVQDCLIRIEPFTSNYLKMQSGRFDFTPKVYKSFSYVDNYELIPELYFCPEAFYNFAGSCIPNFERIGECKNAIEIVYKHRKMLESDEVSSKINKWIDLIWGCKQKGKMSVKFHNYYHPFIMEDVWENKASLLIEAKRQVHSLMNLYGLMPIQLFTELHPSKSIKNKQDDANNEFVVIQKKIHSIPLIYASCISDNCFITIDSRGKVITCVINLNSQDLFSKEFGRTPLKIAPGTVACSIERGLLFLSPASECISIFQFGSMHTYRFFTSHFIEINVKKSGNSGISNLAQLGVSIGGINIVNPNGSRSNDNIASLTSTKSNENQQNATENKQQNNETSTDENNENENNNENAAETEANANENESTDENDNSVDNSADNENGQSIPDSENNNNNNNENPDSEQVNSIPMTSANSGYDNNYISDNDFEVFIHSCDNHLMYGEDNFKIEDELTSNSSDFIVIDSDAEQSQVQENRMNHIKNLMNSSTSMFSNFDSIYGSQKYFLIVKDRSIVSVYDTMTFPEKLGEIVILEDAILHCQVSQQFNVIAILSRNGFIHIHSLSTLQKAAVIDISKEFIGEDNLINKNSSIVGNSHKKPKRMIITPRWCFIVVDYGCDRFDVFTINGLKITESNVKFFKEKGSSVYWWSAASSLKDFDYVLFVDTKGNIGYFEAFNPNNVKILTQTNASICHMDYCRSEDCVYVITTSGYIIIIQHPFSTE